MKIWVHIDGRQLGPYNPDQLPLDEMDATTPVWYDGLEQWTPAGQAPATASLFLPPEPPAAPVCADDRHDDTAGDVEAEIEIITSETEETPLSTDSPDAGAPETDDTETPEGAECSDNEISAVHSPAASPRTYASYPPSRQDFRSEEIPCPPTYLIWSILLTICCCNPLGIIPIITGAQVSSRYNNMDFEGARRASYTTQWWVIICFVLGLMMLPFSILIYL